MLILLTLIELLHLHLQRIVYWMTASPRPHYHSKIVSPISKRNHRHSPQKPEWLKTEIIRLKGGERFNAVGGLGLGRNI